MKDDTNKNIFILFKQITHNCAINFHQILIRKLQGKFQFRIKCRNWGTIGEILNERDMRDF